jgi:hypothetical protein
VNNELGFPVRRLATDGLEAWRQVIEGGCEGYGAKDERTPVKTGQRAAGSRSSRGLDARSGPLAAMAFDEKNR